jgi:Sec-independent protein translocase protein TatA
MTRSARQLLLVLVVVALLVGLITPAQLGAWVRAAATWMLQAAHTLAGGGG